MKLRQLRYLYEVARHNNNISAAAEALHTSQPGVSKQIQLLESELGFAIFNRNRNRNQLVELTAAGKDVIEVARRILTEVENLQHMRDALVSPDGGTLTIATTHIQARYVLPRVIERLVKRYPKIRLSLRQGNTTQICTFVDEGEADIAIGTESEQLFPNLVMLPCFELSRSVVTKVGHPLLEIQRPTLRDIAAYPIMIHQPTSNSRWKVMNAFEKAGLKPNVISSAVNADIRKKYTEFGMGIAIFATVALDPEHDVNLRAIDASHLFEPSIVFASVRRSTYLRRYLLEFIQSVATRLSPEMIIMAVRDGVVEPLTHVSLPRL